MCIRDRLTAYQETPIYFGDTPLVVARHPDFARRLGPGVIQGELAPAHPGLARVPRPLARSSWSRGELLEPGERGGLIVEQSCRRHRFAHGEEEVPHHPAEWGSDDQGDGRHEVTSAYELKARGPGPRARAHGVRTPR